MSPRRIGKLLCVVLWMIVGCLACQSVSSSPSSSTPAESQAKVKKFHPYRGNEVPQLKDLIQQPGFQEYVTARPYILGTSYDGAYLATIVFDNQAQAYRMEIHHTLENEIIAVFYLPLQKYLQEKTSKLYSKNEAEELLQASQETIDLGYRIKVQVKPVSLLYNQKRPLGEHKEWWLKPAFNSKRFTLSAENGEGVHWQLLEELFDEQPEQPPDLSLIRHPLHPEKWTVLVVSADADKTVRVSSQSVDTNQLIASRSENELLRKARLLCSGDAQLVYRYHQVSDFPWYLAVSGGKQAAARRGALLYQGWVNRFALMNENGFPLLQGKPSGVYQEKQQIHPLSKRVAQYYLTLIAEEHGHQPHLLVADLYDEQKRLIRTYEWAWEKETQQFRFLKGET